MSSGDGQCSRKSVSVGHVVSGGIFEDVQL